jgi:hypothetical protein
MNRATGSGIQGSDDRDRDEPVARLFEIAVCVILNASLSTGRSRSK